MQYFSSHRSNMHECMIAGSGHASQLSTTHISFVSLSMYDGSGHAPLRATYCVGVVAAQASGSRFACTTIVNLSSYDPTKLCLAITTVGYAHKSSTTI